MKSIKRTITFIIMVVMFVTAFPLVSSGNSENVVDYHPGRKQTIRFDKSTGEIIGSNTDLSGRLTIPKEIDGVSVTSIGEKAFKNRKISEIFMLPDITQIGESAFEGCINLKEFKFTDSLKTIGKCAFKSSGLESIDLPDSVVEIGEYAFSGCSDLKTVKLPSSFNKNKIENGVFKSCGFESIELPDSIVEIGDSAFEGCINLKTFKFPSYLNKIGKNAFKSSGLEKIALPDSIVEIGASAFEACSDLKTVYFSSSLKVIEECVFKSCGFESLNVPDSIVEISKSAFEECSQLKTINFSDSLKSIGEDAFKNCICLTDITIPASVENISEDSFILCDSLQSINVAENNMFYTSVDGVLFTKKTEGGNGTIGSVNEYVLISYPAMKSDVEYSIPDGVQRIADYAFYGNEFLCSVTIPDSVAKIGSSAFCKNRSLKSIVIPDSVKEIGRYVFSGDVSLESAELSKSIKAIPFGMFNGCESLKKIEIHEGVDTIEDEAFWGCSSLETISFPRSLKYIKTTYDGEDAVGPFSLCLNIKDVYYTGSVTEWEDLSTIRGVPGFYEVVSSSEIYLKRANVHFINPFKDIEENDGKWYTDSVMYCFLNGYLSGVGLYEFDSHSIINRQMFATVLARIDGVSLYYFDGTSFRDVPKNQWYSKAIEWAYQKGYTAGLDRGIFGRKYPVTREQLATFLYTYSEKKGYDVSGRADITGYTDWPEASRYAIQPISWVVYEGIFSGKSDTVFAPKDNTTRAELAVIIKKYVEKIIPVKEQ